MLAAAVVQSIYRSDAVVQILDVCGLSKEFSSTSTAFWPRVHHLHAVASKSWHHAHHVSAVSSSCQHACVGSHRWPASTGWLHTSWKARHRRGRICIIEELSASASSQHVSHNAIKFGALTTFEGLQLCRIQAAYVEKCRSQLESSWEATGWVRAPSPTQSGESFAAGSRGMPKLCGSLDSAGVQLVQVAKRCGVHDLVCWSCA